MWPPEITRERRGKLGAKRDALLRGASSAPAVAGLTRSSSL